MFTFPFRGKSSVEMSESRTDAATAPGAGARDQYPPGAPAQVNTAAASYPPAAFAPSDSANHSGPSGGAPSYSAYPAATPSDPQEKAADVVVQFGEDKPDDNGYSRGYNAQQQTTPPPQPPQASAVYGEDGEWTREVRRGFIRKVLFIVFFQLLLTTGVAVAFYSVDEVRAYVKTNIWPFLTAWALSIVVILVLACVRGVNRYPYNYMLLLAFTTCFSVFVGCVTTRYDVEVIAMALAATTAAVLGAWVVAAFTPLDLTNKGGILVAILFGVICVSFLGIFWRSRILYLVISMVSAVLFTFFLIYDIQKLMGNRRRAYSPDDYIIASLNIYLDIVQIFLNLLHVLAAFASNG